MFVLLLLLSRLFVFVIMKCGIEMFETIRCLLFVSSLWLHIALQVVWVYEKESNTSLSEFKFFKSKVLSVAICLNYKEGDKK